MTKVVVIGGTGEMGRLVVRSLLESGNGYEVVATGRRKLGALADYLQSTTSAHSRDRLSMVRLDLDDLRSLDELIAGARVLVNCSGPYYRLSERLLVAALKAGSHYVDIADEIEAIERLLSYHPLAEKRGITAVVGMGWTPGLTNIAARAGVELLDQAHAVRIHWAGSAADSPGLAVVEHVLHVSSGDTWQYERGQMVKRKAMSGRIRTTLPMPFGSQETFYLAHPEPVTFPRYFPLLESVEVRGVILPRALETIMSPINRIRLARGERGKRLLSVATKRLLPAINRLARGAAIATSGFVVEVEGVKAGEAVCLSLSATDSMARLTALPCFICANRLANGQLDQPGVYSPEGIMTPDSLFKELASYGVSIEISKVSMVKANEPMAQIGRLRATAG
jgi:lysine 6-dehydrogenase